MNNIYFAAFMEEFLEDRANAHVKAYADNLARTGDLKGARRVDHDELVTATQGLKAKKAAQTPFFGSERLAKHVDTGPSFGQEKKEVRKGIRGETGKLTPKGKAIYTSKNARLVKHMA